MCSWCGWTTFSDLRKINKIWEIATVLHEQFRWYYFNTKHFCKNNEMNKTMLNLETFTYIHFEQHWYLKRTLILFYRILFDQKKGEKLDRFSKIKVICKQSHMRVNLSFIPKVGLKWVASKTTST